MNHELEARSIPFKEEDSKELLKLISEKAEINRKPISQNE